MAYIRAIRNIHEVSGEAYVRGLRTSISSNASAFGFSVVATSDFAVLKHFGRSPDILAVFLAVFGAAAAFTTMEAVGTRFFKKKAEGDPSDVLAMGAAFDVVSMSAAVGVAILFAWLIEVRAAWFVALFFSTATYILVLGLEVALAEVAEKHMEQSEADTGS